MKLNQSQLEILESVSKSLDINSETLYKLIDFESNWNHRAKNKLSSAKGLLQFTNSTAQWLGYKDSQDLIDKNNSIESQLLFPVLQYLQKYYPFPTKQSLYMSVFYPGARNWNPNKEFPENVKKVNPGITTVQSYIDKIDKNRKYPLGIFALIALGIYIFMKG